MSNRQPWVVPGSNPPQAPPNNTLVHYPTVSSAKTYDDYFPKDSPYYIGSNIQEAQQKRPLPQGSGLPTGWTWGQSQSHPFVQRNNAPTAEDLARSVTASFQNNVGVELNNTDYNSIYEAAKKFAEISLKKYKPGDSVTDMAAGILSRVMQATRPIKPATIKGVGDPGSSMMGDLPSAITGNFNTSISAIVNPQSMPIATAISSATGETTPVTTAPVRQAPNTSVVDFQITVDSAQRDIRVYPYSTNFTLSFVQSDKTNPYGYLNNILPNNSIKNLLRFEVIGGIIPNIPSLTDGGGYNTPYLLIGINELNPVQHVNASSTNPKAIGIIEYPQILDNSNNIPVQPVECYVDYGKSPMSQAISTITTSLYDRDGSPFTFGFPDSVAIQSWTPGVTTTITTATPHNLTNGAYIAIRYSGSSALDGKYYANVIDPTSFSVAANTTGATPGTTGWVLMMGRQFMFTYRVTQQVTQSQ